MSAIPAAAIGAVPAAVPTPFLVLGVAGLIPFVAGAAGAWFGPEPDRSYLLYAVAGYAMVILSFVGALHWGVAMMDTGAARRDQWIAAAWSVMPALVGWAALQLPTILGLRVMAATFIVQLAMDRRLARAHPLPAWFMRLRIGLTAVVVPALVVATLS